MASEMENLNPSSQVQEQYYLADDIKSAHRFPNTHHSQMYVKFLMLKDRAECFHQRKTSARAADCSVWCVESFGILNRKWKGDAVARY
jgi:hypothetical protein